MCLILYQCPMCLSSEHLNHSAKSVLGFWVSASEEGVCEWVCDCSLWPPVDVRRACPYMHGALCLHTQPCMCTYATDTLVCLTGNEQISQCISPGTWCDHCYEVSWGTVGHGNQKRLLGAVRKKHKGDEKQRGRNKVMYSSRYEIMSGGRSCSLFPCHICFPFSRLFVSRALLFTQLCEISVIAAVHKSQHLDFPCPEVSLNKTQSISSIEKNEITDKTV